MSSEDADDIAASLVSAVRTGETLGQAVGALAPGSRWSAMADAEQDVLRAIADAPQRFGGLDAACGLAADRLRRLEALMALSARRAAWECGIVADCLAVGEEWGLLEGGPTARDAVAIERRLADITATTAERRPSR